MRNIKLGRERLKLNDVDPQYCPHSKKLSKIKISIIDYYYY